MGYFVVALLGGFLFFNSQATPRRAEQTVEKVLQGQFPGAKINADIEGKRGFDVLNGRFKRVDVSMAQFDAAGNWDDLSLQAVPDAKNRGHLGHTNIKLRDFKWNNLQIESVDLTVNDLTYDWDALKKKNQLNIVKCGPVKARLIVPEASLQTLMKERMKEMPGMRISLQAGQARISGTRSMPLIGVPLAFTLTARPEVRNGNEIWLAQPRIAASSLPLLSLPADALLRDFNPIYVFGQEKEWPFRVQVKSVQARPKKLEVSGDLVFIPARKTVSQPKTTSS